MFSGAPDRVTIHTEKEDLCDVTVSFWKEPEILLCLGVLIKSNWVRVLP